MAAINCDEESNKPFCGSMGVQGFPTLKIVRPGKKIGRPAVEDYQGQRSAKAIVDAVKDKIPNHVKRVTDKDVEAWVKEGGGPKALLFSDKGTTSALLKALAVDFLGSIEVGQIRSTQKEALSTYDVSSFPTLLLFATSDASPQVYTGEMTKDSLKAFLSTVAAPNPDPAPQPAKSAKGAKSAKSDAKKASKASSSFSSASASHESADSASARATQTSETLDPTSNPTTSPDPLVNADASQKPIQVPVPSIAPPIPLLATGAELQRACLTTKSGTCVLALISGSESADAKSAVQALSEIHHRHGAAGHRLFPFYAVPATNEVSGALREALAVSAEGLEVVAVTAKRGWFKRYAGTEFGREALEAWVDAVRMGEGKKERFGEGILVEAKEEQGGKNGEEVKGEEQQPAPEMQFEEISDEEYERLMNAHKEVPKEGREEHDEL